MVFYIFAGIAALYLAAKIGWCRRLAWCDWIAFMAGTLVYLFVLSILSPVGGCGYANAPCSALQVQFYSLSIGLAMAFIIGVPLIVVDLACGGAARWARGRLRL